MLVATTAGEGHFGPLIPFTAGCRDIGHDVVVAAPRSFATSVKRAGFAYQPLADTPAEELGAIFDSLRGLSTDEANARVVADIFAGVNVRAALPGMRDLIDAWSPDVILRESVEFASYLAAERAGVPQVEVAIGLTRVRERVISWAEPRLTELRASVELPPDPGFARYRSSLLLSLLPPTFDDSPDRRPLVRRFRADSPAAPPPELPDWWPDSDDPFVYVTFGSVAAGAGWFPDFYRAVVDALADLPVRILLTLGRGAEPSALEPLPRNVHVEKWWPQEAVMPHAAALVGHGGVGTTLSGLAAGVPMVVTPLFADQPYNAERVEAVGVGVAVNGGAAGVHALGGAVEEVLSRPAYRETAAEIAAEIRSLPPVADAMPHLRRP